MKQCLELWTVLESTEITKSTLNFARCTYLVLSLKASGRKIATGGSCRNLSHHRTKHLSYGPSRTTVSGGRKDSNMKRKMESQRLRRREKG